MSGPFQGGADPPLVDVVVVTYESRDGVLSTLSAVERHAALPVCVHVVDNASTDGTAAAVRAAFPRARVAESEENAGFATACNRGWRAGSAPLVLFLNPDAEVRPGAVEALARVVRERTEVGIAGPRTLNADGTVQVSTGPDPSPRREAAQRRLVRGVARREPAALAVAEARHAREHEPDWVSGACLMARRSCLEQVGGFDEGFFLYEEDADLCRRARSAGWRVVFTPEAVVVHALGRSMARAPHRARLEYHRSHLRYYDRHLGIGSRAGLRAWLLGRSAVGWVVGLTRGRSGAGARAESVALARVVLGRSQARATRPRGA